MASVTSNNCTPTKHSQIDLLPEQSLKPIPAGMDVYC